MMFAPAEPELQVQGETAITVRELGKRYEIYAQPRDRLLQSIFRGRRQFFREFWALANVSFEVKRGETLGIVGRNGSGKSTLLQLVAGILTPTTGKVEVGGRVAALLELGSGFNPEFTGRENVYLNGSILGISRDDIDARFGSIAKFAGIGEFIEQPVKIYSSGMFARLAFSIAVHTDPEVLIVDETLSVGDEAFQRKCFARIHDMRERGASILFVSHSPTAVVELCDRALLLDRGELLLSGPPKQIVALYQKLIYAPTERAEAVREAILGHGRRGQTETQEGLPSSIHSGDNEIEHADYDAQLVSQSTVAYESHGARILDPHLEDPNGRRVNQLVHGDWYVYAYGVEFLEAASVVSFGMLIKTVTGVEIGGGTSAPVDNALPHVPAGVRYRIAFRFRCLLNPGTYFLNAGVMGVIGDAFGYLDRLLDVAVFRVKPQPESVATGNVDLDISCVVEITSWDL